MRCITTALICSLTPKLSWTDMQRENIVVPECYVDTNLMNVLVGKACNHKKGCTNVCKVLDEKLTDQFAIAVIDKDKKEPASVQNYELIAANPSIMVSKHRERPHYLIHICPAIEEFIIAAANEPNVNLAEYGLPSDREQLKHKTKTVTAKEDEKFARLFKALRPASNIRCLDELLQYLLSNKYEASNEGIMSILNAG